MKVPTLQGVLSSLPPGVNPFEYGILLTNQLRFPTVPRGTDAVLVTFSIFHVLTALSCLVIIARLCCPSSSKQKAKYGWLFKKIYLEDENGILVESTPLYLPNSGLMMAGFQFIASMVAQVFIWLTFFSFKSYSFAAKFGMPIWLYVSWLFGFYAFWIMTWASVYTRLYTQKTYVNAIKSAPFYMFTPRNLNGFFMTIPILVTIAEALLIYWTCVGMRNEHRLFAEVVKALKIAAAWWADLNSVTDATKALMAEMMNSSVGSSAASGLKNSVLTVMKTGYELLDADQDLIEKSRVIAYVWGTILVSTSLIYAMSMWSLIRLIKSAIPGERKPRVQVGLIRKYTKPVTRMSSDLPSLLTNESITDLIDAEREERSLKRGLRYLSCHSLVMILAIVYSAAVCFVLGIKAEEVLLNAQWHGLGSWLSLLSGVFMGIGMCFQFWRIWVDLDIIIPVQNTNNITPPLELTGLVDSERDEKYPQMMTE